MNPFDTYEARSPSIQNAIDVIPGWNGAFPPQYGVVAGEQCFYADPRIRWAIGHFGSIEGANVLELGPMEGGHTCLLHEHGANITAIEANKGAFLKCLITKEIVGLPRAKFLLGDCVQFLEQTSATYDLVVACGVLYHMRDPLHLLEMIGEKTDAIFIWTHYVDEAMLAPGSPEAAGWASTRETHTFKGRAATLYRRNYVRANEAPAFCGGMFDEHRWMARTTILETLASLGFASIAVVDDNNTNPHGQSFSLFAKR